MVEGGEVVRFGSLTREAGCKSGRSFFIVFKIHLCAQGKTLTISMEHMEGGPRNQCSEFSGVNYGTFPGEQCMPNTAE